MDTPMQAHGSTDQRWGTRLDGYLLQEVLGRGGMGIVYRAVEIETGDEVALKLMTPDLSHSSEFRQRFLLEGSLRFSLDHPNVVPIYGSGEVGDELYLTMRLIRGRDLKGVLRQEGPLSPRRALNLLRQVAQALDYAHQEGLVHGDIKPQNILVATDGEDQETAYLTDFGLVKPTSAESTASHSGRLFGSIQYMAPEQIEQMPVDGRTDVYSLGCVLYELLTGSPPFEAGNEIGVVWAHIHQDPPRASSKRSELPRELDDAIVRAMSKHPGDRFLTCGDLIGAVEMGLKGRSNRVVGKMRPLVERIPRRKTPKEVWAPNFFPELQKVRATERPKVNWMLATAASVLVLSLVSVQLGREGGIPKAAVDVGRAAGDAGEKVAGLIGRGVPDPPHAGESGTQLRRARRSSSAVVASGRANDAGSQEDAVPGGASDKGTEPNNIAVPEGTPPLTGTILFESTRGTPGMCCDYGIYSMNADGSGMRPIYNDPVGDEYDAAWSPDGEKIAFVQGTSLAIMNADGSNRREIFSNGWAQDPAWSPDGSRLAFSRHPRTDAGPTDEDWDVWTIKTDGSGARPLTRLKGFDRFPAWVDRNEVAFSGEVDGSIDIYSFDLRERQTRRLTRTSYSELMPAVSFDGRKIAFVANRGGSFDIYVKAMRANASEIRVTRTLRAFAPTWSPDGNWIAFSGGRGEGFDIWGEHDIFLARSSGAGKPIRWTTDPPEPGYAEVWDFNPSWIQR